MSRLIPPICLAALLAIPGCIGVAGPGAGGKPPAGMAAVVDDDAVKVRAPVLAERWGRATAPTRSELLAVSAPSALVAFAAGTKGAVVKTLDGGVTWTLVTPAAPLDDDLVDVAFLEARTGWALGHKALYTTTDGGATWTTREVFGTRPPLAAGIEDSPQLALASYQRGAVMGRGAVFATEDGGATWKELPIAPAGATPPAVARAAGKRLVPMGAGYGLVTTAGGLVRLGGAAPEPVAGLEGFTALDAAFRDAEQGWLLGLAGEGGAVRRTRDGGRTWTSTPITMARNVDEPVVRFPHQWAILAVADGDRAWAIGKGNQGVKILETADGATWQHGRVMDGGTNDIALPDANHGYVVGAAGVVHVLIPR